MRIGRVLVGIIVVVLVAFGLIYLDQHGYLKRTNVERNGSVHNETPPVPADEPADTPTPNPPPATAQMNNMSPDDQFSATKKAAEEAYTQEKDQESRGQLPIGTARADYESTMRKAVADRDLANKLNAGKPSPVTPPTTTMTPGTTTAMNTQPAQSALPRGAVMDVNGNPCMPIHPRIVSTVVHHYRRRMRMAPAPMAPAPSYVTYAPQRQACGMYRTTSDGMHVVDLPTGMLLNVSVDRELSTRGSEAGQTFSGNLVGPITYCGRVIVPAGSAVTGSVANSHRRGLLSEDGTSDLELRLNSLQANGYTFRISGASRTSAANTGDPYRSVTYDTVGNDYTSYRREGRDVDYPASSVVSFWLQNSTPVTF